MTIGSTGRSKVSAIYPDVSHFQLGRADRLREGADVTIIAIGLMVERALAAAATLANEGIEARVLNMASVRPLDTAALEAAANDTGAIVVAEEHLTHSGLGAMCAQHLATRPALFHGHGADTDIIVASTKAYLGALNRLLASLAPAEAQPDVGSEARA